MILGLVLEAWQQAPVFSMHASWPWALGQDLGGCYSTECVRVGTRFGAPCVLAWLSHSKLGLLVVKLFPPTQHAPSLSLRHRMLGAGVYCSDVPPFVGV